MNPGMNPALTPAPAAASVVGIAGELTICRAAELKPVLLPGGSGPVEIDLAEVTEIDTAGVQLLLLARREALATSRPWRLRAASPPVREALALLNLGDRLAVAD